MALNIQELRKQLCGLIAVNESNLGLEVSLPVLYPDGENVTVWVKEEGDQFVVDDRGYGAMYLAKEGHPIHRRVKDKLVSLAARYGCEFIEDKMARRCSLEQVAVVISIVANASRTIGDQAMEIRRRTENEFRNRVSERLRDAFKNPKRIRTEVEYKGHSGRTYRVDNVILDPLLKHEVAFIEAIYARPQVLPRAAQIHDLKSARNGGIHNDVALDDLEEWRSEDRKIFTDFGANHVVQASQLEKHVAEYVQ